MHFAGAARVDEEMRAGDVGGDRKPARGDFAGPATGRRLDRTVVEQGRKDNGVAGFFAELSSDIPTPEQRHILPHGRRGLRRRIARWQGRRRRSRTTAGRYGDPLRT